MIELDAGMVGFTSGGQNFSLPLSEFCFWLDEARQKCTTQYELCVAIQDKVAQLCEGVLISIGAADSLSDQIPIEYAKKKRRALESIGESQKLVSSTASGVADSHARS